MPREITWLHISDCHINDDDNYDRELVIDRLFDDLVLLREQKGFQPDCIFLTGDLSFSGQTPEYQNVERFVLRLTDVTHVSLDRIFCVPGNHDVNRSYVVPEINALRDELNCREEVSAVLGEGDSLCRYTARHEAYFEFVKRLFPWAENLELSDLSYSVNLVVNDIRMSVIGLNSVWVSSSYSDQDVGQLLIGERQVNHALDSADNPELIVALFHHPIVQLAGQHFKDFDVLDVHAILNRRCDFVLCGHKHESEIWSLGNPGNASCYLTAGGTYTSRRENLSYNACKVFPDRGLGLVAFRQYSDRDGGFWGPADLVYSVSVEGVVSLILPQMNVKILNEMIYMNNLEFRHIPDTQGE